MSLRKFIIILPVFLVILSSCGGKGGVKDGPEESFNSLRLRIMSFNIQQPYGTEWDKRKDIVVAIINNEQPDIVGTQEAVNYQRDYLISKIADNYAWFGSGRDGDDSGEGSWIFWKADKFAIDSASSGNFWLSDTPEIPSRFGGLYNRICTYVRLIDKVNKRSFYVFNIHNYLQEEFDYRIKAVRMLTERIACREYREDPVFITGDFNSPEDDAVTIYMKKGTDNPVKCRDSYRDYDPAGLVITGFGTKLDYIYYPDYPNYSTSYSYVVTEPSGASDHMPIVADVVYYYR